MAQVVVTETVFVDNSPATSTKYVTKTTAAVSCPAAVYDQCGGKDFTGCKSCVASATCFSQNGKSFQKFFVLVS